MSRPEVSYCKGEERAGIGAHFTLHGLGANVPAAENSSFSFRNR